MIDTDDGRPVPAHERHALERRAHQAAEERAARLRRAAVSLDAATKEHEAIFIMAGRLLSDAQRLLRDIEQFEAKACRTPYGREVGMARALGVRAVRVDVGIAVAAMTKVVRLGPQSKDTIRRMGDDIEAALGQSPVAR